MAAKLRPRVMLPRSVLSKTARGAEARGRQLQRLVGRLARYHSRRLRRHGGPSAYRIPVYAAGDIHDGRENCEEADRPNEERVVLVHEEDVEVGVKQGDAGPDNEGTPYAVQYYHAVRSDHSDDGDACDGIGKWEAEVL